MHFDRTQDTVHVYNSRTWEGLYMLKISLDYIYTYNMALSQKLKIKQQHTFNKLLQHFSGKYKFIF